MKIPLALLAAILLGAIAQAAEETTSVKYQVTGLFSKDRVADLRAVVEQVAVVKLVSIDYENAEATFRYDPKAAFPGVKPGDVLKQFDNKLRQVSRSTFGVRPLRTIASEKLERVEIAVAGCDCKACSLGAYEAIYRLDGVEQATASFREGRVTALIDPARTDRAKLVAALKKRGVTVKATLLAANPPRPVKVFILAGQSNMEGKAKVALLEYQAGQPATREPFRHLRKGDGWAVREDVWIKFLGRKGSLTVGFGSPNCIGPELEFGNVIGDHFTEQVLLIKTAWGGRSLYRDFRSPSAGLPPTAILDKLLAAQRKRRPEATLEDVKKSFGATYRDMLDEVRSTLGDLKKHFPAYAGQGHELAGLVWFQGWNDMIDATATAEYTANLAHFIRDVRKDLKAPSLPVVVGEMGVDGESPSANVKRFKAAQAAILDVAEFKGNVALVKTDRFWDADAEKVFKKGWRENLAEWNKVGSDYPYHYLGSAKTMCRIGKAFGEAMLELRKRTNTKGP